MHKAVFLCNKGATANLYSRIPGMLRWCKVEGRTWTGINRGFSCIKSLKRRHLSGCRSPPLPAASGLWPGIRTFLHERISRYSSEVSGASREDRSRNGALRTYASVCSVAGAAGKPLDNSPHPRPRRDVPRFSRNLYSTTVTCYRDRRLAIEIMYAHVAPKYRRIECHRTGFEKIHRRFLVFDFSYSVYKRERS